MSGQILPVVRLLLALCRHLSLRTMLSYSADFLGCLLDKIVKQKQVWVFSLKAEDPGNSCESCQLHKTLINSICLQALFLVFYSSDEWRIWGLCLSMSTLRQKNLIQFKREVDLLVRSLPLQTLGLEVNISKRTNPPKAGLVRRTSDAFYSQRKFCWNCNALPHYCFDNIFVSDHLLLRKLPFWYLQKNDKYLFHLLIGMAFCCTAQS